MTPRDIIAQAWAITTTEKPLWRWGFIVSLLQTLLNVKLIGYQIYFAWAAYKGHEVGIADDFIWLYNTVPFNWFLGIVIGFILLLITEFLLPHLCEGAIIGLAAKSYRREPLKGGLVIGLHNYFSMFAIHELFVLSGWATLTSAISLTIRYVNGDIKYAAIVALIVIYCISNTLKLFAGFAEEAAVLRKKGIAGGIVQSYKLLISNLSHIMFILILLFVISLRVVVNAVIILVIPFVVVGLGLLLATFLSTTISYIIAAIAGVGLVITASYFFAYLHVFKQTVWTLTYIELSSKKDLDIIIDDEGGGGDFH